jgi:glycosyltransferase involved in cell wall biosynthesis
MGSGYEIEQTSFALKLIRCLRQWQCDLLHVQDPQVAWIVQRAHQLGWLPTRTILAHGTEEPLEFQRKITYLQHLAPWHLEEARAAGVWKSTWTAIPNFIDTNHFAPGGAEALRSELGIPPDGLVVLTVAAIKRHHKRIDYLINEFLTLRQRHPELPVWLVIAGGREHETDSLIQEGNRLLGDRVRFLVQFPRERMPELYRAADVFVLCSLKEMMPIALLEATASGLPCVVNRHPVVEWMIGSGGRAIDMEVAGELAGTLGTLLHDSELRRGYGRRAREDCESRFSQGQVVDQILDYYDFVRTAVRPENTPLETGAAGSSLR